MCFILNAELNVYLTARYSRCMFSNAELNVEPIARHSKLCFISNAEHDISDLIELDIQDSTFSNAELHVEPIAR